MRFALLGSGSRGNAALVCTGQTQVLLDCGLGLSETERRMAGLGFCLSDLHAVVVTHEHSDHIGGVASLVRRYGISVWMTRGTLRAWRDPVDHAVNTVDPHTPFAIRDLDIQPYPVPHDAEEPCQYVFFDGQFRLGVCSDAGNVTPHMRTMLSGCDALLLEFNHDIGMLWSGPYPTHLKQRVAGRFGHLSNGQAGELLESIDCSRLQRLVLTHLSQYNNTPDLALTAAYQTGCCDPRHIACASQQQGIDWCELA